MKDDAVTFRQLAQGSELFGVGIAIESKREPDVLETDWDFLRDAQRSPEIKVAFGAYRTAS